MVVVVRRVDQYGDHLTRLSYLGRQERLRTLVSPFRRLRPRRYKQSGTKLFI